MKHVIISIATDIPECYIEIEGNSYVGRSTGEAYIQAAQLQTAEGPNSTLDIHPRLCIIKVYFSPIYRYMYLPCNEQSYTEPKRFKFTGI
jgi:hypothetical protein